MRHSLKIAAREDQEQTAEQLRASWEEGQQDPLIFTLADARRAKEQAEELIRELLAYGREFVQPSPIHARRPRRGRRHVRLRGAPAYGHRDVATVAVATGAKPREWRVQDPGPASGDGEVPT